MKPENKKKSLTRRRFLQSAAATLSALSITSCSSWHKLIPSRFQELDKEAVAELLKSWEKTYSKQFGTTVKVTGTEPIPKTKFGYGLDLSRCVGCRRCVYACVKENNQSRDPQIHWIQVMEMEEEEGINLEHANPYYKAEDVPREGHFYMPVQCQQCDHPPCVKTCPVSATWKEPDGIVVIDYDWCIGCRCCMAACPYGARHFNWTTPTHEPINMHLFDLKLPSKQEIEDDDVKDYISILDQAKFPKGLRWALNDQGYHFPPNIPLKVVKKGQTWALHHGSHKDKYLLNVSQDKKSLKVSEIYPKLNTNTHYLGNRPRPKGVVEKCTFCIQRTRKGLYPACVEVCPVGARKFGNLLDPNSEIRQAMKTRRVFILKSELNTKPSFFYFFS